MAKNKKTKIGIVGCGAIGEGLARFLERELHRQVRLAAIADKNRAAAAALRRKLRYKPRVCSLDALMQEVDLVIESASVQAAHLILEKAVRYRRNVVILSVGALLDKAVTLRRAIQQNITVYVPSGAVCGVDALGALSMGSIEKITLTTSKPPRGLMGAEYFKRQKIDLVRLRREHCVFKGNVAEAIKHFPKNINVAATLLLASSFGDVQVYIKANPHLKRNTHRIQIEAKEARVSITVENVPSLRNPKTSALAILSTQHLLKKIFSPFKIGS